MPGKRTIPVWIGRNRERQKRIIPENAILPEWLFQRSSYGLIRFPQVKADLFHEGALRKCDSAWFGPPTEIFNRQARSSLQLDFINNPQISSKRIEQVKTRDSCIMKQMDQAEFKQWNHSASCPKISNAHRIRWDNHLLVDSYLSDAVEFGNNHCVKLEMFPVPLGCSEFNSELSFRWWMIVSKFQPSTDPSMTHDRRWQ
jgi:hypothetical protein